MFYKIEILLIIFCILFNSCQHKNAEPSFYYWKTQFNLSEKEKSILKEHTVKNVYVRFFDVDIKTNTKQPEPLGIINGLSNVPINTILIPVIFITNRTFLNSTKNAVDSLANHVLQKVNSIYKNYNELQIDCDWSSITQQDYFNFLRLIKKLLPTTTKLTATIRLHQIKYAYKTGIPPVDGGMLMFYNMGNIHKLNEKNSIFDDELAKKYTDYIAHYKLHLDVALPIFRWYIHYRNGKVIGLITKQQIPITKNSIDFKNNKNTFIVIKEQLLHGIFYKKNDVLKFESLTKEQLLQAAELLNKNLSNDARRIVLYDLDEININYYDKETIKNVFATFN